jgi:outer membrane biosynthesis protein TonB
MQNTSMKRSAVFVAGALALAGAFFAGAAYAADPRLDEATDLITKTVAVLKAAENPDPKKEFGGHRRAAIELLTRAQGEILKAKQFADAPSKDPKPPTPKDPKPPTPKDPKPPTPKDPKPPTSKP